MMGKRDLLFAALVLGGASALALGLATPRARRSTAGLDRPATPTPDVTDRVDRAFRDRWRDQGLTPAPRASDLALIRRLSLALTGTIPSLEEIRRFEALPPSDRVARWLDELLLDRRSADYLAERLARAFVGVEGGPFLVYRRRKFVAWLGDELHRGRPYDEIVRDLIAGSGVWTDRPSTNFISVTFDPDKKAYDPERLAARVARSFLGVRIDCAQCHDHPFQPWKRADFRGIAAYFGQVEHRITGITDGQGEFQVADKKDGKPTAIEPRVPYLPESRPRARDPSRAVGAVGDRPQKPELLPGDGQPGLGPPVRPTFGRADRRPAHRRRPAGPPDDPGRRLRRDRVQTLPADPGHRRHRGVRGRLGLRGGGRLSLPLLVRALDDARSRLGRLPDDPAPPRAGRRRAASRRRRPRRSTATRTSWSGW